MKAMTRCLAFVGAFIALTSANAATPTAVWSGTDLADGTEKGGMTLHLNGNTAADGVITIGDSVPAYIDTGLTSSSENEGTEATVVITWSNVDPSVYGAVTTFTTPSQTDAVGVECYGYEGASNNSLYWVYQGKYVGSSALMTYPNDLLSHTVAFACASPSSGTGSGGYNGGAFSADGEMIGTYSSLVDSGNCITRINVGGYQSKYPQTGAKITRIAVYTSALSEADLKAATAEDDPEPEDPGYDEEVLASFFGFEELTNGNYTASVNGNTVADGKVTISKGAIKITSDETWTGTDVGISVLVKYSDFVQPSANAALVTLKNTQAGTMDSGVGVSSVATTAKIRGIWQGAVWENQACDNSIAASGYIVLVYQGKVGTTLYDGSGNILYQAAKLVSSNSQTIGDVLTIGALGDNTLPATDMVIEGARIFKGALSADEITAAVEDFEADFPEPEPGPEVFGAACLYDWTFTNTVENTGSKNNIKTAVGSQKSTAMTGDNNAHYTNQVDGIYTALKSYVRPYVDVNADGGQSFAYYGTVSPQINTIIFALGPYGNSLFLATGANDGEILLARTTSQSVSVANSTLETITDVESPATKPHLYVLYISSDKLTAKVTIDGEEVASHAFASAPAIGTGVQICGMYGGKPTNWSRDESATTAAINCLRVFDHELTETENNKLMAEFKPYWPEKIVVPDEDFTYEPKAGATPTGWITGWSGELFTNAGQFRIGPDGECVSMVSSGQHPHASLPAKSNYTMALYADISQMAYDKAGRYMLDLGNRYNGINQGILMTQKGYVQLYQANKTTIQYTLNTTNALAAGYHLFVWTQSTTEGGTLYIDGVKIGTLPGMTSATSAGFQIGNMHGGVWNGNYSQGIGMAVAGVYGWGQVLTEGQVAKLAESYPYVSGVLAKKVSSEISGTLNLVKGDSISNGTYSCSIAVADGATVDLIYDGEVKEGAQILQAKSISVTEATFTINGQPLPKGLAIDSSNGCLVVGKIKMTTYLNPYAVKEGDAIKVSCNPEADKSQAANAYDENDSTYFEPGSAANANGVSWTGIEFTNGVIVTRVAYSGNTVKRLIGGAFQGANLADFSDATNIHVVAEYSGGTDDVTLDEAKGPYKYLRFMGMYGGNVKEIRFYGLSDSGDVAPTNAPTVVDKWSKDGVAGLTIKGDETIPQVFIVQRAMRNFCEADGSDYETCASLAPQLGETMTWNDSKATGYAMYRVKGVNANGESDWTYFEIEPEKLIEGAEKPTFGGNLPGFYATEATVTISYPVKGAKIYYTTDGSTPTTNSTLYTDAIKLVDVCSKTNALTHIRPNPVNVTDPGYIWKEPTEDQPNVNIIRARAFMDDGSASTNDVVGTWLVGETVNQHKLRVISIQTDADNLFGDPKGILVPGDIFKTKGWPGGTVGSPNANYFQSGTDWERPAQIEIFETDGTRMLASPIGTRVRGNWSRAAAKKSLTCYFRKEYGQKNAKLKLFNDEGKMKFKRFILRNGGNDWYKFGYRDAIGQNLFRGYVSTGTQGFEPGVLYINGEYWGFYNLRHCFSKHHFEEWNNSVGDDIDYVKMSPDDGNHFEVQEGDLNEMWNIMQYLITHTKDDNVLDDDEYAHVESQIDIADMIDYYIVNVFLGNNDWNGNNMGYWRNRTGDDQKWHFTVYDCDSAMSFGGDSYGTDHIQMARSANDTDESQTRMVPGFLKRCFYNADFKKRFANRYADLLNTALKAERTTNYVAQVAETVRHELPRNITRWTNIGSEANWNSQLETVTKFFYKRPGEVFNHILSHCNGGSLANITLADNEGNGSVKLNTITSGKEFELPFTGRYFTDIPVTLTATPESGYEFSGWKVGDTIVSTDAEYTFSPTSGLTVQAVFTKAASNPQQALRIVEIYGSTNTEIDPEGNTGEFVVITNTSDEVVELAGMTLVSQKVKKGVYTTTLTVEMTAGQVPANGSYKLEQTALWPDDLTRYISNGEILMTITDDTGVEIQQASTKFDGDADGKGASMIADNLENPCSAWRIGPIHDVPPTPPPVEEDVVLEGTLTNDVVVTAEANVKVTLNGVTSKDHTLTLNGPGTFTIYYPEGTTNTFSMANNKAALIATNTASVVIAGPGAGGFTSTKKIGEFGVIAAKDLTIAGGTTTVTFNQDKPTTSCIYLTGNYWQTNGTMNVVMPKTNTTNEFNGIQLINKKTWAKIDGGAFNATIGGTKSNAIKLKGSCNGYFNGGTITASLIGPQARVTNGGTQDFTGGSYVVTMPEDYASLTNARVFKVDKALTISGGTFDVSVPSEGSEVFATEEGMMTIAGGTFRLLSGNDCVSAEVGFTMTGGTFYGISTGNDVIDSNADIEISGGLLLAYTTAVEEDGYGSLGLDVNIGHTLTISGGTVVALGGPNSKWPDGCVFNQTTYTNVDLDATLYSEKFLVLDGELNKTTVKLPKMSGTFSLLASGAGIAEPTVSDVAPTGTQVAEGVPAWITPKHNQQFLRFHEIYGNTSAEGGDTDEYIVLTNVSSVATVQLAGLKVNVEKYDDWVEGGESGSKCKFTLESGSVAPGGSVKFDQATYWGGKKQKITNGDLYIALTDADGETVQSGETSNDFFPECDGNGASLMAKTFGKTLEMTQDDWEPSFRWYYFTSDDTAATITGFGTTKLTETTLTIPRELGKVSVTTIAENAFAGCAMTTLKVTLTNETLEVLGTGGASITTYDMSESEGELVLGYALGSALDVSGTTVLGTSAATLAFDLGEGVNQEVSGTTSDAAKLYGLTAKSGILGFSTTNGSATPFRDRIVTADGSNAVVKAYSKTDTTGYSNPAVKIVAKNGGQFQIGKRDTLVAPVELCDGEVKLLAGCADSSRGLDLYNANGNNWTITGNSFFSVDPGIGSGDGRKVLLRNGNWNVDVAADSTFQVDATIISYNANAGGTRGKIVKTGAGTLYLAATDSDYTTATEVKEGALKLADNELQGALVMSAGTSLDLHYDGTPTHGTIVLTAASLTIPDDVTITVDGEPYLFAKSETTLTIDRAVAQVNGKAYGTIVDAAKAAGDGGVMTLLLPYETLKDEIDAAAITLTPGEGDNVYTNNFKWAVGTSLIITEIMPKPTDGEYDVNGVTSGWVELQNTTNAWVDLKDYKFIRVNRSKANSKGDYGNFPSDLIGPTATYKFLTSERYANSADSSVSAWEHGTFDGKPVKYGADLNNVMVWGDKVNPKKFCFVRLYYAPNGTEESIVDTVVIPSDLPESWSIKVDPVEEGVATTRWMQPRTSTGEIDATHDLIKVGPNVGPLYEIADGKKHDTASEFGAVPPAKIGEDYAITFALNPVMHPTEAQSKDGTFRDEDTITNITLVYRTKLSDTTVSTNVDLATKNWDAKDLGYTYQATIPHEAFDEIGDGQLIQWKFIVADKGGNTWTTPSFNNKDDGYEWYGTITEPSAVQMSAKLPTWHMFADSASLADMDKDADKQSLTYNARVAIYDSSTSNYYDYVRIDLRGNTTKNFTKMSHGFRFAKAHPLTMTDVITGETFEEIRKTSLIAEYCDPTYLRQLTSFWIWRQVGNNVPFDFPTRANLNGEFYQLGFNSERFTDELVEDVYKLDKYGYSYKSVGTLQSGGGSTAGGIEKKTPDDGNEDDVAMLQSELRALITGAGNVPGTSEAAKSSETTDPTGLDNAALTKVVVQKFDLSAWINYLASARITQECDDVWGNLCMFYDKPEMKEGTRGTGTWMPLGYDFNLSLGQHYMDGSVPRNGLKANYDWFKSHPFYGGHRIRCWNQKELTTTINYGNYGFEAVWQSTKFRRLYLRRLRTLMDQLLKEPGTPAEEVPIMEAVNTFADLIAEDAVTDRTKWPIDSTADAINVWGIDNFPASVAEGIEDLWTNYIQLRQTHFYVTHSVTNDALVTGYGTNLKAGIPLAQSDIATLKPSFGYELIDGGIKITNSGDEVIDISGWVLGGPVAMTIPNGTVLDAKQGDANGEVYFVTNRIAYCAANVDALTDQVIVGNATAGVEGSDVTLKTANGEDVIVPDTKSEQEKYLRLWGFCGAPDEFDEDKGEFFILTNFNQTAALDVGGLDLNFCGADKLDSESKCHIVLNEGLTIPAGGWLRICLTDTDKFTGTWTKIANHQQRITICDNLGVRFIYFECVDQDALGVYCNGYALRYDFPTESWQRMLISDMPGSKPAVASMLITGDYPNGTNIVLTADANFIVSNATFGAALSFTSNFVATVQVPEGTTSTLPRIDAADAEIVLDGTGTLTISNNVQLIACAGITIKDVTLNLDLFGDMTDTMVAAEMSGNYLQQGGTVNLRMSCTNKGKKQKSLYGFRWKDKPDCTVTIEQGGVFHTELYNDSNAVAFKANDPSNTVLLDEAVITGSFTGVDGRFVDTKGTLTIKGGSDIDVTNASTDTSIFKADSKIALKKLTAKVKATGTGSKIFSSEDSIEVGHDDLVLYLVSQDKCFNAETNITFTKGVVYCQSEAGNAFSTNATFTISGGTVVALGGTDSIWPNVCEFGQPVYTSNSCVASDWSDKYLVAKGSTDLADVTMTVQMPTIANVFSMLVTTAGLTGDLKSSEDKPSFDPIVEGVPVWIATMNKTFQEYLRYIDIYGSTSAKKGDEGEWFILTNICDKTVVLTGLNVELTKTGDEKSKCKFSITNDMSIAPYQFLKFDQADWTTAGWTKITNGDIYYKLSNNAGTIQEGNLQFCAAADGGGASMVTTNLATTLTYTDWEPSFKIPATNATESADVDLDTDDEVKAKAKAKGYEVQLTEDDKAAGVPKDSLMMDAVPITDEYGIVTNYHAQAVINPSVVMTPKIGCGTSAEEEEVKPIVVTSDEEGNTTVSVGINNATKGLWYGYEVSEALGTKAFANDVDSFKRATGEAISIEGSKRSSSAAFFRVKVLPAKPTK